MREFPKPNIVEVLEALGGDVRGADRGGWRKATCPVHDDKNPSASINEAECRFHCFACGFDGDAVDLIMEVQGVGQRSALEFAARFLDGSGEAVLDDSGSSGSLSVRPRGNKGYRNKPAPWLRL